MSNRDISNIYLDGRTRWSKAVLVGRTGLDGRTGEKRLGMCMSGFNISFRFLTWNSLSSVILAGNPGRTRCKWIVSVRRCPFLFGGKHRFSCFTSHVYSYCIT
jgi:hypothetical protein